MTTTLRFQYDDGGRAAAGYKGKGRDCVVRSIAIATGKPYQEVYDEINALAKTERLSKPQDKRSSARNGVNKPLIRQYLKSLGWAWTPTMKIGQGCKVHLRAEELPYGRLIVSVSGHITTMIDGVIRDNHDPRNGPFRYHKDGVLVDSIEESRCVYGYWRKEVGTS